jgi:hypothetical protein
MTAGRALSYQEPSQRHPQAYLLLGALAVLAAGKLCSGVGEPSTTASPSTPMQSTAGQHEVSTVDELQTAVAQLTSDGGTIHLRAGDYVLDQPLEIHAKCAVQLIGAGWDCRIIRRGDGVALSLADAGFCAIRNLLVLGDASAQSGSAIVLRGASSSCTIDSCRFVNFPDSGVRFEGDPTRPMSSNAVRDCHFIGNLGDQLYSVHNNDFYIVGNQFGTHRGHPRTGCVLDHSSAGSYSLNYHWGNQVALRMGPGTNYNRVENNRFEECRESALVIGSDISGDWNMFHIITGNTFHTNSQAKSGDYPAVVANNAHDVTFCQNQVFSWDSGQFRHKHSLVVGKSCSHWIIKDNILRHNTLEALVCPAEAEMLIKDNLTD